MKAPDTVTVHHLVTTTIPVTFGAPTPGDSHHIVLPVDLGTPVSTITRLTPTEAVSVLELLAALDTTLPAPDEATFTIDADATKAVEALTGTARLVEETLTPAPKPTPTRTTGHSKGGQRMTPESAALNGKLRQALASGKSMQEAADAAGITYRAAQQRAIKYGLRPGAAPKRQPAPAKPKAKGPVLRNPKPKPPVVKVAPAPNPVTHARPRVVPVLGARRRILALYAIGYDPARLNARLNNTGVLVSQILADDVTEIDRRTHDTIVELFDHLKYQPVTASPAANVPRSFPPPGRWDNIDDPNEHHDGAR